MDFSHCEFLSLLEKGVTANRWGVSLWGDENIPELDSDNECINL